MRLQAAMLRKARRRRLIRVAPSDLKADLAPNPAAKVRRLWSAALTWLKVGGKAITGFTTMTALIALAFGAAQEPAISVTATDPSSAFRYPFHIQNESILLPIDQVRLTCHLDKIVIDLPAGQVEAQGFTVRSGVVGRAMPHSGVNLFCGVRYDGRAQRFTLKTTVHYRMLFRTRSKVTYFTWMGDAKDPAWVEGEVEVGNRPARPTEELGVFIIE